MTDLVTKDSSRPRLTYTAPRALAQRYGVPDDVGAPLGMIDALTDAAVG